MPANAAIVPVGSPRALVMTALMRAPPLSSA
jgi:hypothetical protein